MGLRLSYAVGIVIAAVIAHLDLDIDKRQGGWRLEGVE